MIFPADGHQLRPSVALSEHLVSGRGVGQDGGGEDLVPGHQGWQWLLAGVARQGVCLGEKRNVSLRDCYKLGS